MGLLGVIANSQVDGSITRQVECFGTGVCRNPKAVVKKQYRRHETCVRKTPVGIRRSQSGGRARQKIFAQSDPTPRTGIIEHGTVQRRHSKTWGPSFSLLLVGASHRTTRQIVPAEVYGEKLLAAVLSDLDGAAGSPRPTWSRSFTHSDDGTVAARL